MIQQPANFRYGHEGLNVMNRYPKYYKDALYTTLEQLRPTTCLEIGTYAFGSAQVFQDYFDNYPCPDNRLITCDIFLWGGEKPEQQRNVDYLQVCPHFHDKYMFENSVKMIPNWQELFPNSISYNVSLINTICHKPIDFAFIDADHRAICLAKDLEMCRLLRIPYILLEDVAIEELIQESSQYYHSVVKASQQYACYDFENWDVLTNCALLVRK